MSELSNTSVIAKLDSSSGLVVKGESYLSASGFEYFGGERDFEGLKIVELICRGVGVEFLTRIRVFDQDGVLVVDIPVDNYVNYSRDVARQLVLDSLVDMLEKAALVLGKLFLKMIVYNQLDAKLKTAYYKESYNAILRWAASLDINFL